MGKKYTTDEIEVGGHMLDASMMGSLNTVVTNSDNYLTSLPSHNHAQYIVEGGTSFSGVYPMVVRVGATSYYSDQDITFTGASSQLYVGGSIRTPILYDSNNTGYYVNPASTSNFNVINATGGNSTEWNTAYDWGNHASKGYSTFLNNITLNDSTTTASFITELTSEHGAFQDNYKVFKVSWSYAGNSNLDVGFETVELAGCLIECWGGTYKHVRLTRPTTGTGGRSIYVYNDQGSSYSPGWRQIWTSDEFSSTNIATWNTAYGWGNHASAGYVTSSGNTIIGTDADINTSGATIIDNLYMTDGVITSHGTRNLTLADLGYTGATNANNYAHPSYNGDDLNVDTGVMGGATVISDLNFAVTTDTQGHVSYAGGFANTRTLTLANLGYTGATNANYITNNNQLTNGASYLTTSGKAADSNLLDGINSTSFLRSDTTDHLTSTIYNRGYFVSGENGQRNKGLFGVYDSYRTAPIWSMGTAYKNHVDGTNFGNLYGLAYKHTNNPTGGTMGGGHQMVWAVNGTAKGSIGNDAVWHTASMKAPIFYDSNNTAYQLDLTGTSRATRIQADYIGSGIGANTSGSYRLNMGGNIRMNNNGIDYLSQLHFQDNVRFYDDGNDSYLNFKYGDATTGGIRFINGDGTRKGSIYADGSGFGLLDSDGSWALRTQTGTNPLELRCDNNTEFYVYNSYTYSPGSSRAPIFYDSNNTGYYLNPASTSTLNRVNYINNTIPIVVKVNSGYKSWAHHISSNDDYVLAPSTTDGSETWSWNNGFNFKATGDIMANNFLLRSDERLKTKITDLPCDNIDVAWKSFELKSDEGNYRTGVIAQELEKTNPEFVDTDDKGFKSVKYIDLLIAKIAELEARLEKLEK